MQNKVCWIQLEKENAIVTDYYLHIVGDCIEHMNYIVQYSRGWNDEEASKADVVVVSVATSALRAFLLRKKYIFWAQGLWPEESYMRNKSSFRKKVCNFIEKIALKNASKIFVVSKQMLLYYEQKYCLKLADKAFVMPCSNEKFHPEAFTVKNKYEKNVFCFAGGTSVWQCFEETVQLYSLIEKKYKNTKLLLLVKDKAKAKELLQKYDVKNFEIDFVTVEELEEKLKQVKFGFLLREDSPVNRVATPTKLLTYLANGIIPVYSDCLEGVEEILEETEFKVIYKNDFDVTIFSDWLDNIIGINLLLNNYQSIYNTHYSEREKKKDVIEFLKDV